MLSEMRFSDTRGELSNETSLACAARAALGVDAASSGRVEEGGLLLTDKIPF